MATNIVAVGQARPICRFPSSAGSIEAASFRVCNYLILRAVLIVVVADAAVCAKNWREAMCSSDKRDQVVVTRMFMAG